ncbi:MAG: hypothetical protein AAF922_16345 [Pseudomonadota bacterium]
MPKLGCGHIVGAERLQRSDDTLTNLKEDDVIDNPNAEKTSLQAGRSLLAMAFAAGLFSTPALAQAPAEFANASPWVPSVRGGAIHQFDTDLDSGGDFSVSRAYIEPGLTYVLGPVGSVGVAIGYGYSDYSFSSASFRPWSDVNDLSFSIPIRWAVSPDFQIFAAPSLRFDWESGADMEDGFTAGAIVGAGWRISDTLFIGPGVGVFSGLEEDVNAFPVLVLDWQIADNLALKTGSGLGASRGPGLSLEWQASQDWTFGLGSRYEEVRFRLDDTGPVPDGVGEDRAVPIFLTASWAASERANLTAVAGVETAGRLSVEDSTGLTVSRTDYDPGFFLGFAFNIRFGGP